MRRVLLIVLLAIACDGRDLIGPPPDPRFLGVWSLQSVGGDPLPQLVITPSDTLLRVASTVDITASEFLHWAVWTDSIVTAETAEGGTVVEDRTQRLTLTGSTSGDTISFRQAAGTAPVLRFVLEGTDSLVRLDLNGGAVAEGWTRH